MEKRIEIDWNNEKSIEAAEKLKTELENDGYSLRRQVVGLYRQVMIYGKN